MKDTNKPEYNHKQVFSIERKSRALQTKAVRLEVWCKGGWFHSDKQLGHIKVPLADLLTQCPMHDSFDITNDRKNMVGGKLEVRIRVRNPIITKQLEKRVGKWLLIDWS